MLDYYLEATVYVNLLFILFLTSLQFIFSLQIKLTIKIPIIMKMKRLDLN